MTLPDRVFTIGGAGKDIGMELLESDWLLREILRPRRDPKQLTITFLDTAEEERDDDLNRIEAIRQRRDELKAELRDTNQGRVGDIDIRYKLITENIMLNSQIDLTGEDIVPRIVAGNGIDEGNWWIDEDHIEENLNFAKGAVRKRGLGKAMYYKAYAEDDELATLIDIPSKGEVAIIGGLGGGTGRVCSSILQPNWPRRCQLQTSRYSVSCQTTQKACVKVRMPSPRSRSLNDLASKAISCSKIGSSCRSIQQDSTASEATESNQMKCLGNLTRLLPI